MLKANNPREVLTTGEVARICNVAPRTVSKWFDSGSLHGYRIPGSKDRRIPLDELIRFMRLHGIPLDVLLTGCTRVLIIDGELEIVEVLQKILEDEARFEVQIARGGFAAGIVTERFRPHVILLDMNPHDVDAAEVARQVKKNDHLQLTKIIAISANHTSAEFRDLLHNGFDGVLCKPFRVREVVAAIENVMSVAQ